MYNAMPIEGVIKLTAFMADFMSKHSTKEVPEIADIRKYSGVIEFSDEEEQNHPAGVELY
jgi:hypothetical protein